MTRKTSEPRDKVAGRSGRITRRGTTASGVIVTRKAARDALGQVVYARSSDEDLRAARLREGAEIVAHVTDWAGGLEKAGAWYRSQPIPALGGRTAEALVMDGEAALVREYLDHLSQGGHA